MVKKYNVLVFVSAMMVTLFIGCTGTPAADTSASISLTVASDEASNSALRDGAPSDTSIDNAISWAESLEGESEFPYADGDGNCTATFMCGTFVANAYGSVTSYGSAHILWTSSDQHPGDLDAPRGSLVFFDRNNENKNYGHVALCLGDGNLIEAGKPIIGKNTISDESGPYLGWAWPPSNWPGLES